MCLLLGTSRLRIGTNNTAGTSRSGLKPVRSVRSRLAAGGSWIRTLGPAATAELGAAGGRSYAAGDVAADARQQTFSFPGDISGHTESKNPVEFRPWSYEFDGKSKCEAM